MDFVYLLGASIFPEYVYRWLRPVLMVLMLLIGIATIVVIMMQKPQNDNIGVIGGQEMDSYSRQNKASYNHRRSTYGSVGNFLLHHVLAGVKSEKF